MTDPMIGDVSGSQSDPPRLDSRNAAEIVNDLLHRLPSYVPDWRPESGDVGYALIQIFGRYMEVLGERLNAVPGKNLLAFLDLLGESLVEARPARVPIVFNFTPPTAPTLPAPLSGAPGMPALPAPATPLALPVLNIRVPAATQVAANPPGGAPLTFETEQAIALASAQIAQVVSVWPGRDTYTDHSADLAAKTPISLFTGAQLTPHLLYLAHDSYFNLNGSATLAISFDLLETSSTPLSIAWEYWDGQGWHSFGDPDLKLTSEQTTATTGLAVGDATQGLTRSGVITLSGDCTDNMPTTVNGVKSHWLRGRLTMPLPPDLSRQDALVKHIRVNTIIEHPINPSGFDTPIASAANLTDKSGVRPDLAFADGTNLDLSKAFYPFSTSPQPGSVFSFSSEEVFSKPGAQVRLQIFTTAGPLGDAKNVTTMPTISWEYWDGARWTFFSADSAPQLDFSGADQPSTFASFTVPDQAIPQSKLNNKDGRWVRARIISGGYYNLRQITIPNTTPAQTLTVTENLPPLLTDIRLGYVYRSPRDYPDYCVTYNDFQYEDHSSDNRWQSTGFTAFRALSDRTPGLYIGFDKALPVDQVSMYLDVQEQEGQTAGPQLTWEYWDGATWTEIATQDDTARLVRPGMLALIGPANGAALPRFDAALYWLRGRLREDGEPAQSTINAIFLNAVWAINAQTVRNEVLGTGSGEPDQTFFFARNPILFDEVIEVRELDGSRAAVELPILAREVDNADLNIVYNANRVVQEVWVRWHRQPNLYLSNPDDRHYVLERSHGKVIFGNGVNGRLLPAGTDNVVARVYRWGGGVAGNAAAGTVSQLLGGIPYVTGVTNPRAAEGGADNETIEQIRVRGPQTLRHLGRAVTAADYEALAHEASPGVAIARVLSTTHPSGRHAPGWIKLIIVPYSQDARPQPSFGLRRQVQDFVTARAPAGLAGIMVTGPTYLPVGAAVVVVPLDATQAGPVGIAVRQALDNFFHPLTGGPDGHGWSFARDVYLSDVAAMLEALPGVDYVQELELLLDGLPQGEVVTVPPDRIVVAGPMRIRLRMGG